MEKEEGKKENLLSDTTYVFVSLGNTNLHQDERQYENTQRNLQIDLDPFALQVLGV